MNHIKKTKLKENSPNFWIAVMSVVLFKTTFLSAAQILDLSKKYEATFDIYIEKERPVADPEAQTQRIVDVDFLKKITKVVSCAGYTKAEIDPGCESGALKCYETGNNKACYENVVNATEFTNSNQDMKNQVNEQFKDTRAYINLEVGDKVESVIKSILLQPKNKGALTDSQKALRKVIRRIVDEELNSKIQEDK